MKSIIDVDSIYNGKILSMEEKDTFSIKGVVQKLKEYVENYTDLAYLKFVGRISKILPGIAVSGISLLFAFFVVFYLSMALAFFIGELLDSYALGFAVTGLVFILLILLVAAFRQTIKKMIANVFIKIFISLRKEDDDEEQNN
ncbi:MAG: phage holin family protein [Olivibacter sp.]|nr:phage holin family protein [Olivibacter sp. UJ_SKK_5.1]